MRSTRMIRGIFGASLLIGMAVPVFAAQSNEQAPMAAPEKGGMHDSLQAQVNSLNLTDDQKSKLQVIFDDAKAEKGTITSDTSLSPDDRKTKMMALRKETRAKVMAVLTPEQRTELKQKMEAEKNKAPMQ